MKLTDLALVTEDVLAARRRRTKDAPPTKPAAAADINTQPLSAKEKLEIWSRFHTEFPDPEVEKFGLRLLNEANREFWGQ
jgi:hypothetical protein